MTAVFITSALSSSIAQVGCSWRSSAIEPAICGAAIEVPLMLVPLLPVPLATEKIPWPGALISGFSIEPSRRGPREEKLARETANAKLANDLADMQVRHGKLIKAMAARAAQAIQQYPLTDGMDAIRAAEIAIKLERVIAGEPSERSELTVAETTKREIERFLAPTQPEPDEEGDGDGDDDW